MRLSSTATENIFVSLVLDPPATPSTPEMGFSLHMHEPPTTWYAATWLPTTEEFRLLVGPSGGATSFTPYSDLYVWIKAVVGTETIVRQAGRLLVYP